MKDKIKKGLEYPFDYYDIISRIVKECIYNNKNKLSNLQNSAVNGSLLIPNDFQKIKISEETYVRLWHNITLIRNNPKFIELFWAHSHQYFWTELEDIFQNHKIDENHNFFIENNEIVENRKSERKRFLEFHYALGGLLLYSENYESLRYIFNYTNQQPPKYELLPYTMTDIFYWFEWFYNENNHIGYFTGFNKYPFPDLNNLGVRGGVTFSLCKYICILFIRQFSIAKTLYYNNATDQPQLPNDLLKLYDWEKCIGYFKFCLNEVLKEKQALMELCLYDIYTNKFEEIDNFICELDSNIKSDIKSKKTTADLSSAKIEEFKNSSKEILEQGFEQFEKISNKDDFPETEKDIRSYLSGWTTMLRKSAFTDGDVSHLNYDSILATSLVSYHLNKYIPNSFLMARTEKYLISNNSLLDAIDKILSNKNNIKIIAFNLEYESKGKLQNSDYKR